MEWIDVGSTNRMSMRMLPKEFPSLQLVYYHNRKWVEAEIFDMILDKLRSKVRVKGGQKSRPILGIMDSQSVCRIIIGSSRVIGNKRVKGIKQHGDRQEWVFAGCDGYSSTYS